MSFVGLSVGRAKGRLLIRGGGARGFASADEALDAETSVPNDIWTQIRAIFDLHRITRARLAPIAAAGSPIR